MKKTIIVLVVLIILLSLGFALFKILRVQDIILKKVYPMKYSEYVEEYSAENGLDKYLVYAVIKAESNFNPNVTSSVEAKGLMQLMEETAVERANAIGNETVESYDLYDPETNIKLGTSYLAYLLGLFNDNIILAVTAYNAGLGNVQQWIQERHNKIGWHRHRKYSIQRN